MIFVGIFVVFLLGTIVLRRIVGGVWSAITTWPWWLWAVLFGGLVLAANLA